MPQAIITKFHGYNGTRPARYSATAEAGRVYMPASTAQEEADQTALPGWGRGLTDGAHAVTMRRLVDKFDWSGLWVGAHLPGDAGMVWVNTEDNYMPRVDRRRVKP